MDWDIKWALLCQHWNCTEHKTEIQCWKPAESSFNGKICIPLNSDHLKMWITAWLGKIATQFISSSIFEFWQLKTSKMPDNHRGGKVASATPKPNQITTSV